MDSDITVKASSILEHITIRVKGLGGVLFRARVARAIFGFGALVAGCAIEIELDDRHA